MRAANMGRMTGFPRDKAWAQRMVVENGGRPHRSVVVALLMGLPEDGWKGWSRAQQVERLKPYVLEGESIRFATKDDEAFIVPDATGGMTRSANADLGIDEMKAQAAVQAHFAETLAKRDRQTYQAAYVDATQHMAASFVELEGQILDRALAKDSTPADRRLAFQLTKDWKDRVMGKAVAPTEDVTAGRGSKSDVRAWMASRAPVVLPVSSSWTPESIAADQLLELEAGTLNEGE